MQEDINKRSPFCSLQNGNNRGSICVQACNNSLMTWEKEDKVCCFMLIKADELAGMAKDVLGPLAKEIF